MARKLFSVNVDGKELQLAVEKPSNKQNREAHFIYSKSVKECLEKGLPPRQSLDALLRKQNLWDDEKEKELQDLRTNLQNSEKKLAKGKIKLSEAKEIALSMQLDRWRINLLNMARNSLDSTTAESVAEQDKFNYLVSACTVYSDTQKPYFSSVEDYLEKAGEDVAQQAATYFANLYYGIQEDYEKNLPENKFLIKYKLMDEKFNLIDKEGNKVNRKGQRIDENGKVLGEVQESEEFAPFLEEDGTEVNI